MTIRKDLKESTAKAPAAINRRAALASDLSRLIRDLAASGLVRIEAR